MRRLDYESQLHRNTTSPENNLDLDRPTLHQTSSTLGRDQLLQR